VNRCSHRRGEVCPQQAAKLLRKRCVQERRNFRVKEKSAKAAQGQKGQIVEREDQRQ